MSHETIGSDLIPGLLEDTDKHIEVADGHHVTAKQKVQVGINNIKQRQSEWRGALKIPIQTIPSMS